MKIQEMLNTELSYKEINDCLKELMRYSCNIPSDTSERFEVFDEEGDLCDFRKHIGMKGLNTLDGIILLKERIDYERGKYEGKYAFQREIKKVLGIN